METLNIEQYRKYELQLIVATIILILLGRNTLAVFTGFIPAYYVLQSIVCPVR